MRDYFVRLMHHPGLEIGCLITILGILAGITNKSFQVWYHGAIFDFTICFIFVWLPILITNLKK